MDEPRRLGGRYELGQVLGRGGMAEVYLAHDTRLGRTVAVKTLRVDLARDPTFQARFRREAQSAASLNHPAIVAVYDTGEDYVDGISIPYIVMEYVDGSTLRELLHSGRKLLPERAMEMTAGILQALEYSHRNGIVHRDIKPANVMLTRGGQVKVMDFGIARAMGDSGMTMTQTAAVIGTAQYLSPEQAKGETVDARSDLYSTGCLLYELLTVRPPFVGDSPVAVAYQHVREEPQPPSVFDPEITPEQDAIVLKALAKDPDYRYQSADEMRADLEASLDGQPVGAAAALGAAGYGAGYGAAHAHAEDRPTQALRTAGAGQTSMLPPMRDDDGGYGYDEPRGRRREQKNSQLSTILLVAAGILVLIGAIFIGKALSGGGGSDTVAVPKLTGLTLKEATQRAQNTGLEVSEGPREHCEEEKDTVCRTDPEPDTEVERNDTITLVMSDGPAPIEVPDVVGDSYEDARGELQEAGFEVTEEAVSSSSEPEGTVIAQDPARGEKVQAGTQVTLSVVRTETRTVPPVTNKDVEQARQQLEGAGFVVEVTEKEDGSKSPNTVISQSPSGNEQAAKGSTVTLEVAKAPEQENVKVPKVVGERVQPAVKKLQDAGFQVQIQGPDKNAFVAAVNPQEEQEAPKGSVVTIQTVPDGNDDGGNGDDNPIGGFFEGQWGGDED
ncbi:Stk1 family PASTA domain-containing Ser/Thr kinase [Streptomyces chumphonensis]|uniref:non-specific serine/threonine protein kinase n=1 Tax=Streptomyces chumphonensis TaxID=1214925 RepID=A0A927F312_9ACTN|nr:Stk1 family PASTA domain-containing Ser/Thr kinase [Streptomyces chumphonensis]MBD3934301.1 Stk1 family PASTA domain-containing Ser/Thr kinase [Streptomyces chumphonensis]